VIPVQPLQEVVQQLDVRAEDEDIIIEAPEPVVIPQTPPPLPAFVPTFSLPKVIPIISSSPAPFVPAPQIKAEPLPVKPASLPIKPAPIPKIQPRTFATTTKSPNEYLPPFDVRSGDIIDWNSWKVRERYISFTNHLSTLRCQQAKYNKRYASPKEEAMRRLIFDDNIKMIVSHNDEFEAGLVAYEVDVNKFCDLTSDEFLTMHTGLRRDARSAGHSSMNVFMPSPMLDMMVEDEVDWRKKGAVTPVKNQGNKNVF
jgi:hypothetical protein